MKIYALYKGEDLIAKSTLAQIPLESTNGKECRACGKILSLNSFYNKKGSKDGKQGDCKSCAREAKKLKAKKRKHEINQDREEAKNHWHGILRVLA